ncbi:hypothetical protein RYX36_036254 [Vicia faba]
MHQFPLLNAEAEYADLYLLRPNKFYSVVGTQVGGAGKKPCVNLILADECGAEIDLTLWEGYANQLLAFTDENATGKLNLSNAWNGSKLLLDIDHPQVVDFKSK